MTLGRRLKDARKKIGLTQKELAGVIGVKHNTVSNWEKDKSTPDPSTIEHLCQKLRITPNYLLIGVDDRSDLPTISSEEIALLKQFRRLSTPARGAVHALLDYYDACCAVEPPVALPPQEPVSYQLIAGLFSRQSVSAGTGAYLDPDTFEKQQVVENDLTKRASFYVPVSGDSMEPKFKDGDILVVEDTSVDIDEIGIFTLDGCGYVKIRGQKELISLNPAYRPIPMKDDILCNGRVIGILEPDWIVD